MVSDCFAQYALVFAVAFACYFVATIAGEVVFYRVMASSTQVALDGIGRELA